MIARLVVYTALLACITGIAVFAFSDAGLKWREQHEINSPVDLPGVDSIENVPYGTHERQKMDVYFSSEKDPINAPIILLVHGGGWFGGDKNSIPTVYNADMLTQKGWIVVSTNYRWLPKVSIIEQAQDVALAIAYIQQHAKEWGGDPNNLLVMGHSSGGYLVTLVTARHEWVAQFGGQRWQATVVQDGSVYDVVDAMQFKSGYDFLSPIVGTDKAAWPAVSPAHNLDKEMPPLLAICTKGSTCGHPYRMLNAARQAGIVFEIQEETLNHNMISSELGKDNDYTRKVFAFINRYIKPTPALPN